MALTKIISTNAVLQDIQNFSPTGGYTVQLFFTRSYLTEILQRPINSKNKALVTNGVSLRYGSVTTLVQQSPMLYGVCNCFCMRPTVLALHCTSTRQIFTLLRTGSL